MKSDVQENMDALSRAILSEARGDADQMLEDARAKAQVIRQSAQEQADQVRKEILDRAKQEANQIRGQTIATTQLKARTMQLENREKLLNNVFAKAMQDLPSVQRWTDYPEIAQNLLREAILQLRTGPVVVRADKTTQSILSHSFLNDLSKELNVEIKLGEPLETGTGVVVEANDGHLQFDNTLETRLQRMQNGLRATVHHLLMGESL